MRVRVRMRVLVRVLPALIKLGSLLLAAAVLAAAVPGIAQAHGPIAPVATSYSARIDRIPSGVQAKVVDGYLRMWLRAVPAHPRETVVVLDYRGAPYLRFSTAGVYVNERSEMYFLNHLPAETPPLGLTRQTPPAWKQVSSGHEYSWYDARIGALAKTVIPPGSGNGRSGYIGGWRVLLLIDGRLRAVSGGLWHAQNPSLVWLWMIVVVIACVLAAWRLDRIELHTRLARLLTAVLLMSIALGIVARELYGRPYVSAEQVAITILVLAFAVWGMFRVLRRRAGYIFELIAAFVALWVGSELWPTLLHGFVLTSVPPFCARAAAVLCLGGSVSLLLLAMRTAQHSQRRSRDMTPALTSVLLFLIVLSGCGDTQPTTTQIRRAATRPPSMPTPSTRSTAQDIPTALLQQARPIGRGPRFRPPPNGPVWGTCSPTLGRRTAAHVEVFAANRVVIVPAGIGVGMPWQTSAGRIARARCYGALVTLEPTGVVLVRRGSSGLKLAGGASKLAGGAPTLADGAPTLADLFRAWGQPLRPDRVASFAASAHGKAIVFVNGRRWSKGLGSVPLSPHAEIVVEVGPRVPPHSHYAFPSGS